MKEIEILNKLMDLHYRTSLWEEGNSKLKIREALTSAMVQMLELLVIRLEEAKDKEEEK